MQQLQLHVEVALQQALEAAAMTSLGPWTAIANCRSIVT